jgi:hypothetical protein
MRIQNAGGQRGSPREFCEHVYDGVVTEMTGSKKRYAVSSVGRGRVCIWRESGVRQSALCWRVWQEYCAGCRQDLFTWHLLHEQNFIHFFFVISVRFAKIMNIFFCFPEKLVIQSTLTAPTMLPTTAIKTVLVITRSNGSEQVLSKIFRLAVADVSTRFCRYIQY